MTHPHSVSIFIVALLLLAAGASRAEVPLQSGSRSAILIGGGAQRFDVMDEVTSPVEWGGTGGLFHLGSESPNRWGFFTLQFFAGNADLEWQGYDGTGVIPTRDGTYYRRFTTRYAEVLQVGLEQNFRLDPEGSWRWWLGPALWIRSEQTAPTPEGIFDYQGYGSLTLAPVGRVQWLPGWDLDVRGFLAVPLCGWIARGPWSGYHPDYEWTDEIEFQVVGEFWEIRTGLAVRRAVWKSLGLEAAWEGTWSQNDHHREYRSVSQNWRLDLVVGL